MTSPLTPPMTRTLTRSIKNTIPTLALLVAILMLGGCVGKTLNNLANRLQSDAEKEFQNLENGLNGGNSPDPCIARNTCVDYTHWADTNAGNPHHHAHGKPIFNGYGNGARQRGGVIRGRLRTLRVLAGKLRMVSLFIARVMIITLGFYRQPDWVHLWLRILPMQNGQGCF